MPTIEKTQEEIVKDVVETIINKSNRLERRLKFRNLKD